jgi:copper chaperone CopZ
MKHQFTVNKMSCEHCKKRVSDSLLAIDGIQSVDIDLGTGLVTVKCEKDLGLDVMAAAVEEAGYIFVWEKEDK